MMKKVYTTLLAFVLLWAFPCTKGEAGTFTIGGKYWYETTWDSALLNIVDGIWTETLQEMGFYNIESDLHVGSGYLAGPVLGYQTSDKIWSISFAPMVFSHFSQKVVGSSLIDIDIYDLGPGFGIPFEGNSQFTIDVTRRDYDLAVSYALLNHTDTYSFLEYCRVFLGLKYQTVSYDFGITTRVGIDSFTDEMGFDYKVYMPTVGVGFVFPLSEDVAAGIQGGIGVAHFSDIEVDDSLAFNVEANVNILARDKMIIQFGYRYQKFSFDLEDPDFNKTYESEDKTYGPTLTLTYAF